MQKYKKIILSIIISISLITNAQTTNNTNTEKDTLVIIMLDATSSLDRFAQEQGVSIRQTLQDVVRTVLANVTNRSGEKIAAILRVCGDVNLRWQGSINKQDYETLNHILVDDFQNCEPHEIPGITVSGDPLRGTNLSSAFSAMEDIIKMHGDKFQVITVIATDGYAQDENGELVINEAISQLKQSAENLKEQNIEQIYLMGLDEKVRLDWMLGLNEAYPNKSQAYGIYDLRDGLEQLLKEMN